MIPFLDVGAGYRELRDELDAAYRRVMDAGWFILGREVEAFEAEFAAYCGVRHCVTVGNGLDALSLALRAAAVTAQVASSSVQGAARGSADMFHLAAHPHSPGEHEAEIDDHQKHARDKPLHARQDEAGNLRDADIAHET